MTQFISPTAKMLSVTKCECTPFWKTPIHRPWCAYRKFQTFRKQNFKKDSNFPATCSCCPRKKIKLTQPSCTCNPMFGLPLHMKNCPRQRFNESNPPPRIEKLDPILLAAVKIDLIYALWQLRKLIKLYQEQGENVINPHFKCFHLIKNEVVRLFNMGIRNFKTLLSKYEVSHFIYAKMHPRKYLEIWELQESAMDITNNDFFYWTSTECMSLYSAY